MLAVRARDETGGKGGRDVPGLSRSLRNTGRLADDDARERSRRPKPGIRFSIAIDQPPIPIDIQPYA